MQSSATDITCEISDLYRATNQRKGRWHLLLLFVSLKACVGFSIFDSISFLLKFIFLFNQDHGLFNVRRINFHFQPNDKRW